MTYAKRAGSVVTFVLLISGSGNAQSRPGSDLADLLALKDKVGNAETRVRVDALHRVWSIAKASSESEVKITALSLLTQPAGSASDHIRMPAVYAIAEIANSTDDAQVKTRALTALTEPLQAGQVPIRDVAIDAVNSITRARPSGDVAIAAVRVLAGPIRSGNNGVRIPAINAVVRAVEGSGSPVAFQAALDLLTAPLDADAAVGGMEVRMMAAAAVETIGRAASDVSTKAKAMGLLQAYAARGSWEPEAKRRAQEGAQRIEATMK